MQKEDRLSFCINLEVVILEVEIQSSFFGRIHDSIDCFRDLLTFMNRHNAELTEIKQNSKKYIEHNNWIYQKCHQ